MAVLKRFLFILSLLCPLLCQAAAEKKTYRVAALYWSMNIEGQVAMRKGLEEQVSAINKAGAIEIKLSPFIAGDGDEGIKKQIDQMNKAVAQKFDLIIIQPTDNAALSKALKRANKVGIPVVAYDQYIVDGELASFITSNNYQAGALAGEYIGSLYQNESEIKIVLVDYPNVSSTIDRVQGFFDALKEQKQKYRVIGNFEAVEPVGGRIAGEQILKHFPNKNSIDVVFTINDGGGLPVADALYKAGRNEVKIATIDGDPKSVENIKNSKLTVIDSAQFCAEIGRESARQAANVLQGKSVSKKVLVPTFPVTKETLSLYPGWMGTVPKSFAKPWLAQHKWDNSFVRESQ